MTVGVGVKLPCTSGYSRGQVRSTTARASSNHASRISAVLVAIAVKVCRSNRSMPHSPKMQSRQIRCSGSPKTRASRSGRVLAVLSTIAATKYPQASITLAVYGAQDDEPIWRDRMATGNKATTGIANTMGVQVDETRDAALAEATGLALDKLIARYREQAGAPAAK